MELDIKNIRGIFCECLIDQNKYIGEDPVGYACSKRATKKAKTELGSLYICDDCLKILTENPERITYTFKDEVLNAEATDNS